MRFLLFRDLSESTSGVNCWEEYLYRHARRCTHLSKHVLINLIQLIVQSAFVFFLLQFLLICGIIIDIKKHVLREELSFHPCKVWDCFITLTYRYLILAVYSGFII